MTSPGVVVVGGGAAGLHTVESLRARGYPGPISLVGDEVHESYERPPLSKGFLKGETAPADLVSRSDSYLSALGVRVIRGRPAVGLALPNRLVHLRGGDVERFAHLVIATGVRPRSLRIPGADLASTLRTVEDAHRLREGLLRARRVTVLGASVLGTEVASTAVAMGCDVVVASPRSRPLAGVFGAAVAGLLETRHVAHGVRFRIGLAGQVEGIRHLPNGERELVFADGSQERADIVVAAIGSMPNIEWLQGSGLDSGAGDIRGVAVGSDCCAAPGVYAAGDVALMRDSISKEARRAEHRTNATDQALHIAERIVSGESRPFAAVPYFWTDQYDMRVQAHGQLAGHDEVRFVDGEATGMPGRFVAVYRRGRMLSGVVAVGAVKAAREWRALIAANASWADASDAM